MEIGHFKVPSLSKIKDNTRAAETHLRMNCGLKHSFTNHQLKDGRVLGCQAVYTEQGLCPIEDKCANTKWGAENGTGFLRTLEAGLTEHSNRHHNLWLQCLNCDLGARPAGALDLLPLKDTEPFICISPSSFTLFSTILFSCFSI